MLSKQLKQGRGYRFAQSGPGSVHESEGVMEGWLASQEQPDIFEVSIIGHSGGPGRQQQKVGR